jgi:Fe-S oxidoreductase
VRTLVFALLCAASFGTFAWSVWRLGRFLAMGRPEQRWDRIGARIGSVLVYFFGQKKVAEEKGLQGSMHHLWIFWGFMLITLGTTEVLIGGLVPGFRMRWLGTGVGSIRSAIELFSAIVLLMVLYAFFRRIVIRPRLIPMSLDAGIILGLIAGLMVTHFSYHALRIAAGQPREPWAWISGRLATSLSTMDPATASGLSQASWWAHVLIVLVFLNYIPYSKHIHLLGALPNIFFRNLGARGKMEKLDLDNEDNWGVSRFQQLTWKSLLDSYACTECARCTNYCPAYNTDKPLSPMHLIHDVHHDMRERGSLLMELARKKNGDTQKRLDAMPPLVGGRIKDETLWACTACGACEEVCPVFIEHPQKILQMRTHLALSEPSRVPAEMQRVFTNIERNGNPWGVARDQRLAWAEGLAVPTVLDNPGFDVLLWVGCAGAYDERIKKQMRALVQVLKVARVNFAVLGEQECCTGDPARRAGNEFLYQQCATENVATLNKHAPRKILTSCPHCFHTMKNEYPDFGGRFEVVHYSQFLAGLIAEQRIKPLNPVAKSITYHDSCYLGRWNGEYDAPRRVLEALPVQGGLVEMGRRRERSFCCGAGGARMWMEEKIGERINRNRVREAIGTGASTIATACPFCTIMIRDGVADEGAQDRVQVIDLAEAVAASLPQVLVEAAPPTAPPDQEPLLAEEFGIRENPFPKRGWMP